MEIQTTYSIGDTIFYMQDNKVRHSVIDLIDIHIANDDISIKYCRRGYFTRDEKDLYTSKEELLKSL